MRLVDNKSDETELEAVLNKPDAFAQQVLSDVAQLGFDLDDETNVSLRAVVDGILPHMAIISETNLPEDDA